MAMAVPLPSSRYPPLWLQAIEEATECLRNNGRGRDSYYHNGMSTNGNHHNSNNHTRRTARGTEYVVPTVTSSSSPQQQYSGSAAYHRRSPCFFSHSPSSTFPEILEASLEYLVLLESLLRKREENWDKPPNRKPPRRLFQEQPQQPPSYSTSPAMAHHSQEQQGQSWSNNHHPAYVVTPPQASSSNRFAAFQTYDNDDDDDDESMSDADADDRDEAGDEPLLNIVAPGTTIPLSAQDMSMRRLLIRVLTNQSEIFAALAKHQLRSGSGAGEQSSSSSSSQVHIPQWTAGAQKLTYSLACIHGALMLADSEISRWLEASLTNGTDWQVQKSGLFQDADIVEVSIESLTVGRELYLKEVRRVQAILIAKLQPQWKTRDEVKAKMGAARWYKNPAPKKDFARIRAEAEAQLRDVQEALQHLEAIQTGDFQDSTERLRNRLNDNNNTTLSWATTAASSSSTQQQQQQRYNGQRPTDLSRRVDITDYPDPTTFGWTFTGSAESSAVEFFEKDNVKLDWYYTTGTVKTSMDHPTRGKTQLFGAKVDAPTFCQILQNPRHHTGQRYHQHRGRGSGGGRGLGGGGGGDQTDQKQKRQRRRPQRSTAN